MSKKSVIVLSLILLAVGLFAWQGVIELRAEEPRRGIVSLEMLLSGNYVVPQINGWSYYNKPPVFNWIMVGFFTLLDDTSEWVVRLPSLLSFVAIGFLCFSMFKRYVSHDVAILSALFWLTSADLLFYGTVNSGEIDIFYSLVVFLQAMSIFIFYERKQLWRLFLVSYLLVTIGFLTKGLPSLAFQALTLLAFAVVKRDFRLVISVQHIAGITLFAGLTGFYLWHYDRHDDALGFLVRQFKEASQRTGMETKASDTLVQTLTFPFQIMRLLLPWSLLAVFFFKNEFVSKIRSNRLLSFAAVFVLVNILLYWFSGDFKARYLYMFLPFLCLLLAYFYQEALSNSPKLHKYLWLVLGGLITLIALGFSAMFFVPEVQTIPYIEVKTSVMLLSLLLTAFLFFKSSHKVYVLVLFLAVARIGFDLIYLPALANDENASYYRNQTSKLLEITGDSPVYLLGQPYTFVSDASIGPLKLEESELTTAPLVAYQIPYYISSRNKQILQFVEEPIPGEYHLAPKEMADSLQWKPLLPLRDRWKGREYVLVKP